MILLTCEFYTVMSIIVAWVVKNSINGFYCVKTRPEIHRISPINAGFFLITCILIFFAVFRYVSNGYGGTDAYSYVLEFQNMKASVSEYLKIDRFLRFWNYSETLFLLITLLFRSLTVNYHIYFLFTYGLIVIGLLSFVYETYDNKSNFFTLILLFCSYLHSYNVMRGWMSIAICMFAVINIRKRKWRKSLFLIFLAALFHYMSLAYLIVWLACWIDYKLPSFFTRRRLIIIVLLSNLISLLGRAILINIIMATKYSYYKDYFDMPVSLLGYIPTFLICLAAIIMYPKFKASGRFSSTAAIMLAVNLALLYGIVYLFAWRVHDYFAPIRMYMLSEFYIVIPEYVKEKVLAKGLISIYVVALFIQSLHGLFESSDVFPYILCL